VFREVRHGMAPCLIVFLGHRRDEFIADGSHFESALRHYPVKLMATAFALGLVMSALMG